METLAGAPTAKTLPETRVNLSPTKFTVALARAAPAAAVKVETRTATVWPGRRTEVSFDPEKVVASAGTMRPLPSTPKVAPVARLMVTGAAVGRLGPRRSHGVGWESGLG